MSDPRTYRTVSLALHAYAIGKAHSKNKGDLLYIVFEPGIFSWDISTKYVR